MREIQIIDEVRFGLRDAGRPVIWFGLTGIGGSSLQAIEMPDIPAFLKENHVYDISDLKGKPAEVETGYASNTVKFIRIFKPGER